MGGFSDWSQIPEEEIRKMMSQQAAWENSLSDKESQNMLDRCDYTLSIKLEPPKFLENTVPSAA